MNLAETGKPIDLFWTNERTIHSTRGMNHSERTNDSFHERNESFLQTFSRRASSQV